MTVKYGVYFYFSHQQSPPPPLAETLLNDMDKGSLSESILILEDNWSKFTLAKNPVNHKRAKHIDIRYHFIWSIIEMGRIVLEYCPTADMVADVMTKPATKFKFEKLRSFIFGD